MPWLKRARTCTHLHNGSEVVVHDDNIRSILRHLRTRLPHSEPNIGALQGRSVVGTISCHCHSLGSADAALLSRTRCHVSIIPARCCFEQKRCWCGTHSCHRQRQWRAGAV